jgi:hypothetical protein
MALNLRDPMPWRILKFCGFVLAVCLGLLGCFFSIDAFLPKERPISPKSAVTEFIIGTALIGVAVGLARLSRLRGRNGGEQGQNDVAAQHLNGTSNERE